MVHVSVYIAGRCCIRVVRRSIYSCAADDPKILNAHAQLTDVAMETGMLPPRALNLHCCLSLKFVDQGVVYPFDYPAYSVRPASETKVSSSLVPRPSFHFYNYWTTIVVHPSDIKAA